MTDIARCRCPICGRGCSCKWVSGVCMSVAVGSMQRTYHRTQETYSPVGSRNRRIYWSWLQSTGADMRKYFTAGAVSQWHGARWRRDLFTRGYARLSTCCNATTESAGKLCCAFSSSKKVSGATDRCWGGGGMPACWAAGYMALLCWRGRRRHSSSRAGEQDRDGLVAAERQASISNAARSVGDGQARLPGRKLGRGSRAVVKQRSAARWATQPGTKGSSERACQRYVRARRGSWARPARCN
jgi:hypothetical protein